MIEVRIACKKHPRYMGHMKPRAKWSAHSSDCPGCKMVFSIRHRGTACYAAQRPWVKMVILRSAPK